MLHNENLFSNIYVFPYHLFTRGEKIIICGDNTIVDAFYKQIKFTRYVQIAKIIDYNDVQIEDFLSLEYDDVLLAVSEEFVAVTLKEKLIGLGVKPRKIKWDGENYSCEGFFNNIYLCFLEASGFLNHEMNKDVQNFSLYKKTKDILKLDDYVNITSSDKKLKEVIDVVVPIYNAYEYTKVCLESVLECTTTPYNLYLVNDCSTDKRIHNLLAKVNNCKKPKDLCQVFVIEHKKNIGFQRTINEMITSTSNHLVLLNSDTEVNVGWLERLMEPIIQNSNVASVTPTTNASSMCSFPRFGYDNMLPDYCNLSEVDAIFSLLSVNVNIEIPVGVGFCLAMNRNALNEIGAFDHAFEKGYGEETDWCLRARSYGWKNMWAVNVFVYHKHGVSFGEKISNEREYLIRKSADIIEKRYPDFRRELECFRVKAPWKNIYKWSECMIDIRSCRNIKKTVFVGDLEMEYTDDVCLIVQKSYDHNYVFKYMRNGRIYEFNFSKGVKAKTVMKLFRMLGINEIKSRHQLLWFEGRKNSMYDALSRVFD